MLRIHFAPGDLDRTHVTQSADPLWEIAFSQLRLTERDRGPQFEPWLRKVQRTADGQAVRAGLRMLSTLVPLGPYFPDFLTPTEGQAGLKSALEAIRATPRARLRNELKQLSSVTQLPPWIRPLAEGDATALAGLTDTLARYHAAVIAPYREMIDEAVETDRAQRTATDADGLLRGMWPLMNWRPPVLEVQYDYHRELHLEGRGLRLIPSYFCRRTPVALADPSLPPTLVFPVHHDCAWHRPPTAGQAQQHALKALIGSTRSAVLAAVGPGATTTELAERLGTSASSISRHTAVLRDAGLLTTARQGLSVLHRKTPLGSVLLGPEFGPE